MEHTDENKNSSNLTKGTKEKKQNETSINQQNTKNELMNLRHVFPFLFEGKDNEKTDVQNEEFNMLMNDIITNQNETFLQGNENIIERLISTYSNVKNCNVATLTSAKMTIAKNFGMMNDFGHYLPNLLELNLEGSAIGSIEDLGSSFGKLRKLNVSKCRMKDLNGIVCFIALEELDASFNEISDLIELEMCLMKVVKLNDNKIEDEDNVIFLSAMEQLTTLTIRNNPIAAKERYVNWRKMINSDKVSIDIDNDYK